MSLPRASSSGMPPRVKHRRSRHGCLRCKSLKVKCDQQRPGCRRCEEHDLRCPGYVLSLRWASKNQLQAQQHGPAEPVTSAMPWDYAPRGSRKDPESLSTIVHTGDAYEDLSWPFDSFPLPGVAAHGSYLLPGSLEAAALPMPGTNLGIDMDDRVVSVAHESGGSDWATPGSILGDASVLFDDDVDLSRSFEAVDSAMPALNEYPSHIMTRTSNGRTNALQQELICRSSALVEYFFKEVVSLYCAWDSSANFMRKFSERRWQSSPAVYHTIQSMSAACLSESFPHLASTAASEHGMAMQCLSSAQDPADDDDRLMSIILLGPTSSWHDPGNLAHGTLVVARRMLDTCPERDSTNFFEVALDYWTMLLSFMTDLSDGQPHQTRSRRGSSCKAKSAPHPFTGISQDIVKILSDVGALVYRHRSRKDKAQFITDADLGFFSSCIKQARNLERQLLQHRPVSSAQRTEDLSDPSTTLEHLEKMDDAYRFTGLLQIYRVFPDLLIERYSPWSDEDVLNVRTEPTSSTKADRDSWLRSFAMHILRIVREIPFESRTRCLQPFILVACSSELARSPAADDSSDAGKHDDGEVLVRENIELMRARDFIQSRLASYRHVLPLRKVSQVQELVKEVWSLLDRGANDVYWLDVCIQKQLVTLPS